MAKTSNTKATPKVASKSQQKRVAAQKPVSASGGRTNAGKTTGKSINATSTGRSRSK